MKSGLTDPSSVQGPGALQLCDPSPHRNVGQGEIHTELEQLPDSRLIATLHALGAPLWFCEQIRVQPSIRFQAVAVWCLVQDAAEGKTVVHGGTGETHKAKDLIDGIREQYAEMKMIELISERPGHTIGLWER